MRFLPLLVVVLREAAKDACNILLPAASHLVDLGDKMSLTLFNTKGIEIVINTRTGEAFTTQNGYTKLSEKPKQTVATRLDRLVLTGQVKKGNAATVFGVKVFKLISAKITLDWLQLDRPDLAAEVSDPTVYLHKLAGYAPPVRVKRQRKPKAVEVAPIMGIPIIEPAPVVLPEKVGNLQRFDRDGIELVIDTRTGEAFATARGYARMSGIGVSGISKRLKKGVSFDSVKTAEIETPGGVQGVSLIPEAVISDWIVDDNPTLAKAMLTAGVRVYLHTAAGFKVTSDAIAKPAPEPMPTAAPQLPGDIRLGEMIKHLDRLDIELLNPRIKQGLQDLALDMLGVRQPALTAENISSREGVWCGVVERAEHLGYSVELILQHRSKLGRHVAKQIGGAVKENRLCNGTYRPINLYRVSDELDATISDYFDNL